MICRRARVSMIQTPRIQSFTDNHVDLIGKIRLNSSWLASVIPLALATYGGFLTCVIKVVEVRKKILLIKLNFFHIFIKKKTYTTNKFFKILSTYDKIRALVRTYRIVKVKDINYKKFKRLMLTL